MWTVWILNTQNKRWQVPEEWVGCRMVNTKGFHFRAPREQLRLSVSHTCTLKGDNLYFPRLLRNVPSENCGWTLCPLAPVVCWDHCIWKRIHLRHDLISFIFSRPGDSEAYAFNVSVWGWGTHLSGPEKMSTQRDKMPEGPWKTETRSNTAMD